MKASQTYNEKELLLRIAEGDEQAFAGIYKRTYPDVFYFARRFVDEEQAKDITAEVFVILWKKKPLFEQFTNVTAYLRTLTRNACIDALRRQKTEQAKITALLNMEEHEEKDPLQKEPEVEDILKLIWFEIEQLPPHIKTIFKMAYLEGLKNQEIAERLGIKHGTVRNKKAEALQLLRVRLKDTDLIILSLLCARELF